MNTQNNLSVVDPERGEGAPHQISKTLFSFRYGSRLKVWSVIKKSALKKVGIKKSRLKVWSVIKKSAVKKVGKK